MPLNSDRIFSAKVPKYDEQSQNPKAPTMDRIWSYFATSPSRGVLRFERSFEI